MILSILWILSLVNSVIRGLFDKQRDGDIFVIYHSGYADEYGLGMNGFQNLTYDCLKLNLMLLSAFLLVIFPIAIAYFATWYWGVLNFVVIYFFYALARYSHPKPDSKKYLSKFIPRMRILESKLRNKNDLLKADAANDLIIYLDNSFDKFN